MDFTMLVMGWIGIGFLFASAASTSTLGAVVLFVIGLVTVFVPVIYITDWRY